MKTILYILSGIILFFNIPDSLMAQEVENPQETFAEKEWYLTKIVMEGEEYSFIPTSTIPNSLLETSELMISDVSVSVVIDIEHCEMCANAVVFQSLSEITIPSGWGWECFAENFCIYSDDADLAEFAALYEGDFWNGYMGVGNDTHYEISISETAVGLSLIITKEDGNQAYYSDAPMSVSPTEKNSVKVYPNLVKDHLYIENLTENVDLEIYDLSGRKLLTQKLHNSSESVNLSVLSAGMYFYQIHQNGQEVKIGKLVKH